MFSRAAVLGAWVVFGGVVLGITALPSVAQVGFGSAADALTSEERPARVVIQPTYQRFEDDGRTLSQWSLPVAAVVPFRDQWQVSLQGSGASAGGDNLQTISGLSDFQVSLSYAQPAGEGSVIFNASLNAPTGKENLTPGEFNTAALLSHDFYRFRVASFGEGLGGRTGVTWAVPVGESVVLGLGGSFQYRGSYEPWAEGQREYNPGEEGRLTGGIDLQLSRTSALSGDLSFFRYGTDTIEGVEQFNTGNRISVRLQYLRSNGGRTLRIIGRYRGQQKSTLPVRGEADRELRSLPSLAEVRGQYASQLSEEVNLQTSIAGRWYDETSAFESKTVVTIGIEPQFEIGDGIAIAPRVAYTAGAFTGVRGRIGVEAQL